MSAPIEMLDPRLVLDRLPNSERALNAQYESTFGLLVSSNCPPYETEYINSKFAFQRSNSLADISGFYHAFGLTTSDGHPERPDHVVLELEFMASSAGTGAAGRRRRFERRTDRQQVCRDAQARFLQEHLAWWTPAFAKLLGVGRPAGVLRRRGRFSRRLDSGRAGLTGTASGITARWAKHGGKTRALRGLPTRRLTLPDISRENCI